MLFTVLYVSYVAELHVHNVVGFGRTQGGRHFRYYGLCGGLSFVTIFARVNRRPAAMAKNLCHFGSLLGLVRLILIKYKKIEQDVGT